MTFLVFVCLFVCLFVCFAIAVIVGLWILARCMRTGRCGLPRCQFGRYITTLGRCPKREERNAHWLKMVP